MNGKQSESLNVKNSCNNQADEHQETSSAYNIKGMENNLSASEKKEKDHGGYDRISECGKQLSHSTYERACAAQDMTISKMKDIVEIYKYEIK